MCVCVRFVLCFADLHRGGDTVDHDESSPLPGTQAPDGETARGERGGHHATAWPEQGDVFRAQLREHPRGLDGETAPSSE